MLNKKSIRLKLSFLILSSTFLLFAILFIYNVIATRDIMHSKLEQNAKDMGTAAVNKIDGVLNSIQKIVGTSASFLGTNQLTADEVTSYFKSIVENNKEIYGSGVGLEPNLIENYKLFGPYYYKHNGLKYNNLADSAYYYPKWDWYKIPKENGKMLWTDPYYDEGGGNVILMSCASPIYRETKEGKKFLGVTACDISTNFVKEFFAQMKICKTGYGFLITKTGTIIAHKDTNSIMKETVFSVAKKNNSPALDSIGRKMVAGETGLAKYTSAFTGKPTYIYYAPVSTTGWSMGFVVPEDEFMEDANQMSFNIIIVTIIGLSLLLVIIIAIASTITKPLHYAIQVAETIADGNLVDASMNINSILYKSIGNKETDLLLAHCKNIEHFDQNTVKNEIVRLCLALKRMSVGLSSLIGQVQHSGIQVTTSATEISASARMLESTVAEQAAATQQVSTTSKDISGRSDNIVNTIENVDRSIESTTIFAEEGKNDINKMEGAMLVLKKATASISSKLSIINDKTNKISGVVNTINKISNKTNLLSLNAAIEAEKAGEYGKGFSVVAKEISRLADQTSVATQEIEQMVKEMRSSVASGVMEMDKFTDEVRRGAEEIAGIGSHLNKIIDRVHSLAPQFSIAREGIEAQSLGASQISEAMSQLAAVAEQTKESLNEFKFATSQLNDAVQGLQSEVTKFKV